MAGSKPGERRGGRKRGTPNRKDVEKAEQLRLAAANAGFPVPAKAVPIKKLGKEILEEFMMVFAGMAASYQPAPPGQPPRPNQDEVKFRQYAELAVDTADRLADFQSPKFRAIAVTAPPADPNRPAPVPGDDAKIVELAKVDPQRAADSYRRFIAAATKTG